MVEPSFHLYFLTLLTLTLFNINFLYTHILGYNDNYVVEKFFFKISWFSFNCFLCIFLSHACAFPCLGPWLSVSILSWESLLVHTKKRMVVYLVYTTLVHNDASFTFSVRPAAMRLLYVVIYTLIWSRYLTNWYLI